MSADDPRHGTNAGYIAHCLIRETPCQPCRDGHAAYKRNRRTRVYLAKGPMRIDGTGTRRRIRALVAIGHTMESMDAALGHARGYTSQAVRSDTVFRSTAVQYAALYKAWCMTIPTHRNAGRNRTIARRHGWPPPLAWDDIDDPNEQPKPASSRADQRRRGDVDAAVVERVLAGEFKLPTTRAEKLEVTRRWLAAGKSNKQLCEHTGWQEGRYLPSSNMAEAS